MHVSMRLSKFARKHWQSAKCLLLLSSSLNQLMVEGDPYITYRQQDDEPTKGASHEMGAWAGANYPREVHLA